MSAIELYKAQLLSFNYPARVPPLSREQTQLSHFGDLSYSAPLSLNNTSDAGGGGNLSSTENSYEGCPAAAL